MNKKNIKSMVIRVVSVVCFISIWQLFAGLNKTSEMINPSFLPTPLDVLMTFQQYMQDGELIDDIFISVQRVLAGFLIGSFVAVVAGCVIASSKLVEDIFDPIISFIGAIPTYAFMPLFIIWFGIGESAKTALIAFASFMPIMSYTIQGVKSVLPIHIRSVKSLGVPDYKILEMVVLKTATPYILSGMKVSLAMSFSALIVAEMMGSSNGLGFIIINSKNWFKVSDMFMAMTLIGILYLVMQTILLLIERKLCRWQKSGVSESIE